MDEDHKIDPFDPLVVMAFIIALFGDLFFILIIPHYFAGIILLPILWPRFKGWLPKLNFALCVLLPLPVLTIGILQGILLSNKFVAFLSEQVIIQAIAIGTGGAGEALEGAALAGEGAEVASTVAEAGEAAGTLAEAGEVGAEAAGSGLEAGEAGAEASEESGKTIGERINEEIEERAKGKIKEKLSGGTEENEDDKNTENPEDDQQTSGDEDYDTMTPDAERDPIDIVEREELGNVVPFRHPEAPSEDPQTKASQKLAERFARAQAKLQKEKETRIALEKLKQSQTATDTENEDGRAYKPPRAA